MCNVLVPTSPHPSALTGSHLPPGEGYPQKNRYPCISGEGYFAPHRGIFRKSEITPPQSRRCRDSSPYTGEPSPRRKLVLTGKAFPLVFRHAKPRSKRWLAPGWVFYDTFGLLPFSGLLRFPAWEICNTARCGNFRFYRICTPSGRKVRAQVSPTR